MPATAVRAQSNDPLWRNAVRIATKASATIPRMIVKERRLINKSGVIEDTITCYFTTTGRLSENTYVLEKALQNGVDVTEKTRSEYLSYTRAFGINDAENPFHRSIQNTISASRTDESKVIGNARCMAFSYIQKTPRAIWRGIAWLNASSGTPVFLTAACEGLQQGKTGPIRSILMTIQYSLRPGEYGQPDSLVYSLPSDTTALDTGKDSTGKRRDR
jgi:hypothetical protein